jgi:putative PIG3 family NAD(P)H quinone oxidoreductase
MKYLADNQQQQTFALAQGDDPVPTGNQIKIAIAASGINRADLLQLAGKYPPPEGESKIIGLEVAGTVLNAPVDSQFNIGDKVMALLCGGGYAEQVCVDAGCVMKMPDNLSFIEAAALPEAFITAYQALFSIGKLNQRLKQRLDEQQQKPVRVLIHAGASGVGSAAIQLASLSGAEVFTTASSPEKLAAVKALGASHLINYQRDNFSEYIKHHTAGSGVDIIVDFVGGSYLNDNISATATDGTIVNLAMLGGRFGDKFDFAKLLAKRITLIGSTLRNRDYEYKSLLIRQFSQQFLGHFEKGALKPIIDSTYQYQQVELAYRKINANQNIGKLILHSFN